MKNAGSWFQLKHGILAATNKGLFVINNHKAKVIADNRYINFISWQPFDEKYYIAADDGYFSVSYKDGEVVIEIPDKVFTNPVYSIIQSERILYGWEEIIQLTELIWITGTR